MADRGPVKIRQGRIDELIRIYKRAYADLVKTITFASQAGRIQKARTMASIKRTLTELQVDVDAWVKKEIPQYYLDGANQALQDLRDLGVEVRKAGSAPSKAAIAALTDETALAFADGIVGIGRNSRRLINDAIKRQLNFIIAEGRLKGDAARTIAKLIEQQLKREGLGVLVDRAGKKWTFETYSKMLVRTKASEATRVGLANRMLENGYDLVQISRHGSDHYECAKWEGRVLSITGKTPGYPTLDQAQSEGLFHPNCQHRPNVINPTLAAKTKAYNNPFNRTGALARN